MLTVYKASAGSGKTYTLAYEYIKLLLGQRRADGTYVLNRPEKGGLKNPHSRILAITFTNKATAEMKTRIIKELDALTHIPVDSRNDASYAADLMKEFKCSREELREVSETALRNLLHDYGSFNVSTIDAFFQTILRSFAREIDRQGDFRLELDQKTVLKQAISLLFDELNRNTGEEKNKNVMSWLKKMASARMLEGKDYNPFNHDSMMYKSIINNLSNIFNEVFVSHQKEMEEYLADSGRLKGFETWLKSEIEKCKECEKQKSCDLQQSGQTFGKYLSAMLEDIARQGCVEKKQYDRIIDDSKKYIQKIKEGGEGTEAQKWIGEMQILYERRIIYNEMLDKVNTLWAIVYIYDYIERYRVENNLILLSDTNTLLNVIINGSEIPFIYERVGVRLENFLIDEFQDTSRLQWSNLSPLLGNSFAYNHDSLIIGDEKQSIYRWRGGDPDLLSYEVAEKEYPSHSRVKGALPGENTNYRSAHDIVRFNNTIFSLLSNTQSGGECLPGYEGVAQSLGATTRGIDSYIRVDNLLGLGKGEAREKALKNLGESILDQIGRGYRQSDIAILTRSNSTATDIAEYLGRNFKEIKLISDEALLLCNSRAVKLIISLLEILDRGLDEPVSGHSGNNDSLNVTASLFADQKSEQRIYRNYQLRRRRAVLVDSFEYYLAHGKDVSEALTLALEASKRIENPEEEMDSSVPDISQDIKKIRELAPSNLAALVQAIIDLKLTETERREEMPYLMAFVDMVEEFMQDFSPSIHQFLNYWNETKATKSISGGGGQDAVTIITVHKAKGLEWPCVHIPVMNWSLEAEPRDGWFETSHIPCPDSTLIPPLLYLTAHKCFAAAESPFGIQYKLRALEEKIDNLNVAYVAFTRAVRELHINLMPGKNPGIAKAIEKVFSSSINLPSDDIFLDIADYIDADGNFILGSPTRPPLRSAETISNSVDMPDFAVSFNNLNKRLTRLVDLTTYAYISDDDLGDEPDREIVDEPQNEEMEKAARFGLILHSILAQMETINDLDKAIDYHRRDIPASELNFFRETIQSAMEEAGETAARWFSPENPRVLNEQTIYSRRTGKNTRADRIVWLADGSVEVVDYKFTSGIRKSHYDQVRDYAMAIRAIGNSNVRAYLWYPLLNKIIPVEV